MRVLVKGSAPHSTFANLLLGWSEHGASLYPWRVNANPYRVLVAEVLLQKTPRWKVARCWSDLMGRYPDARALANADVGTLQGLIAPLGLASRTKTLVALAQTLIQRHSGEVPRSVTELMALPGVGAYIASAVRCFAFGEAELLLDRVPVRV